MKKKISRCVNGWLGGVGGREGWALLRLSTGWFVSAQLEMVAGGLYCPGKLLYLS